MNNHLSEDQFSRCLVGQATNAELQHTRQCPECGAELKRFSATVSLFQSAVRHRIDGQVAVRSLVLEPKTHGATVRPHRLVLVAAVFAVLVSLPFLKTGDQPEELTPPLSAEMNPEAVMNRVNLHLAQSVPSPMQPLLLGLPKYESIVESGVHP